MARKLIIDLDPGIGDALATVLALQDPDIDLIALTATSGCVDGQMATKNLQAIVEQVDPPKWPRIGSPLVASLAPEHPAALNVADFSRLNGPHGLGDCRFEVADLHHRHESSKVLTDLVRGAPHEVTLLTLGPLTNVAAACERMPEFLAQLEDLVCLGGCMADGGDITAAAEFNMYVNPDAARAVFLSPESKTIVPLDVTSKVVLTFEHFNRLETATSRGANFLRQLLPYAFRAHHQFLGMEGLLIREAVALAAITRPQLFRTERLPVDVETRGELTRGATIFDRRRSAAAPNANVVTDVDVQGILDYVASLLM